MYLVTNAVGLVVSPKSVRYPDWVNGDSCIFNTEDAARRFAEWCAKRNPGTSYTLLAQLGTVCTISPAVEWK